MTKPLGMAATFITKIKRIRIMSEIAPNLITPRFNWCSGQLDLNTVQIVCVKKDKYFSVDLAFQTPNMNVPFAEIRLAELNISSVFKDNSKLGDRIASCWNNHVTKSIDDIRDQFEQWYVEHINEIEPLEQFSLEKLIAMRSEDGNYAKKHRYTNACWWAWQQSLQCALSIKPV
jgi:hypothetical protein